MSLGESSRPANAVVYDPADPLVEVGGISLVARSKVEKPALAFSLVLSSTGSGGEFGVDSFPHGPAYPAGKRLVAHAKTRLENQRLEGRNVKRRTVHLFVWQGEILYPACDRMPGRADANLL